MKYNYPNYKLKVEFTVGTFGENQWGFGECACVDRAFYVLPDGAEFAFFKFCERTHTGKKKCVGKNGITESFLTIIFLLIMLLNIWKDI